MNCLQDWLIDICRHTGISEGTFYSWKKYAELGMAELRRFKLLEDENARLKRIVADLTLDPAGGCVKEALKAAKRRELPVWMQEGFWISVQQCHAGRGVRSGTGAAGGQARW